MAKDAVSGSQLERLGDRLRAGPLKLGDLQQLRSFLEILEPFAEETFSKIRDIDKSFPGLRAAQITRRNVKTIRSIVAKLRRQTTKLVQIQDLVGCRIVVPDIIDQDAWKRALWRLFPAAQVVDRRIAPQHGYRGVHIIVRDGIQRFEVQLRTVFQDEWANIVEKIDDRFSLALKYGVGDPAIAERLQRLSESFSKVEAFQKDFEVRFSAADQPLGKIMVGTYLGEYHDAMEQAYPAAQQLADEEAWEAARRRADLGKPRPTHRAEGMTSARDVFTFSHAYRAAAEKAKEHASQFLRLVLWSSVELPLGSALQVGAGAEGTPERVVILRKSPIEASSAPVAVPTFDELGGGHIYEVTQPATAEKYFLHDPVFGDMVSDAAVDMHILEELLK